MSFRITPTGPFDLTRSIGFLEGWPAAEQPAGHDVLRFAFCPESDWTPTGVAISGSADLDVRTSRDVSAEFEGEIRRILSLDVDTSGLEALTGRDPVVAELVSHSPGLRPVTFWTPWEAACWAVLSQRTSMKVASTHKARITRELGTSITVDDQELHAFPSPAAVLEAGRMPGVNPVKLERIHGLAEAAIAGVLTASNLRAMPADEALELLRSLPGVGPFSAGLILIRGAGAPDVFPTTEPRLLQAIRTAYGLDEDASTAEYESIAANWSPLRSWVSFWLRASQ